MSAAESTNAVQSASKPATIYDLLQSPKMQKQIALALPRGMTPERMTRIVLTEMRRTPKLMECTQESVLGALMQCAQFGLEPGPMGLAYLIPYGRECQFQIGYKGMLALAWRSGQVASIQAEAVCEHDHFDFELGLDPKLAHRPAASNRGDITHFYAVVKTTTGGTMFRVMTVDEIREHRAKFSKARNSPWDSDFSEMGCKTVLKRTMKLSPISAELQSAIQLDDFAERGIAQGFTDAEIDVTPPAAGANSALGLSGDGETKGDAEAEEGPEIDPETGEVVPPPAAEDEGGPVL